MEDNRCQRNDFMTLMKASTTHRVTGSTSNTLNDTIRVSKAIPDHYLDINCHVMTCTEGIETDCDPRCSPERCTSAASPPRRRCVTLVNPRVLMIRRSYSLAFFDSKRSHGTRNSREIYCSLEKSAKNIIYGALLRLE